MSRKLEGREAARFSFLLSVPVIIAAALIEGLELADRGGLTPQVLAGVTVAALSGYFAIELVLKVVNRFGLRPFAWYCFALAAAVLLTL